MARAHINLSRGVRFESERFDYKSELPEDYNAGNRLYGRDVAQFLAEALTSRGIPSDYWDEDWGWLVLAAREAEMDFEVAVYNLAGQAEDSASGTNCWGLWIRQHVRGKVLGFIPRRTQVPVADHLYAAVIACVEGAGATPEEWHAGT